MPRFTRCLSKFDLKTIVNERNYARLLSFSTLSSIYDEQCVEFSKFHNPDSNSESGQERNSTRATLNGIILSPSKIRITDVPHGKIFFFWFLIFSVDKITADEHKND